MPLHRYDRDRARTLRATSGHVFAAISRDEWARGKLDEIYRKLFEGEGVRQGSSPDHFIYVTPGKARAEINELSTWIRDRFGDPGSTVPARTPFGYLSGKYDGWVTFFAALLFGEDLDLQTDFAESVATKPWSGAVSRVVTSTATEAAPAHAPPPPPAAPSLGWFAKPFEPASSPVEPSAPPPPASKPGFIERFLGVGSSETTEKVRQQAVYNDVAARRDRARAEQDLAAEDVDADMRRRLAKLDRAADEWEARSRESRVRAEEEQRKIEEDRERSRKARALQEIEDAKFDAELKRAKEEAEAALTEEEREMRARAMRARDEILRERAEALRKTPAASEIEAARIEQNLAAAEQAEKVGEAVKTIARRRRKTPTK